MTASLEFTILDDALVFHDGVFQHALSWLEDHRSGLRVYRAVMLRELAYVPIEGRDGSLGAQDEELASQQGEMLLRGLAKLRSDFVFAVIAAHIARGDLSKALVKMARVASQVASRQLAVAVTAA